MLDPSKLAPGEEQHEAWWSAVSHTMLHQYDYRDPDGRLYSAVANTLEEARSRVARQMSYHNAKELTRCR